jgi:hypothetical protein
VFNPLATPVSLAAAATARADCLHMALDAWTGIDGGPEIRGIANSLEPIAQELQILLGELTARLSRQERAAS